MIYRMLNALYTQSSFNTRIYVTQLCKNRSQLPLVTHLFRGFVVHSHTNILTWSVNNRHMLRATLFIGPQGPSDFSTRTEKNPEIDKMRVVFIFKLLCITAAVTEQDSVD